MKPFFTQQSAHAAGAVANGIAPVGGRHPLVDGHGAAVAVWPFAESAGGGSAP